MIIVPDGEERTVGLFALEEVRLDRVRLFAGARFDARRLENASSAELGVTAGERSSNALTGSLGASVRAGDGWTISANLGRAWRAPTLLELYSDGPRIGERRYEIGDPDLSPENSFNVDAGVRFERGVVRAEAHAYRNHVDDFVFLMPTDEFREDLRVYEFRQADARLVGVEASADVEASRNLALGARFETVDGTNLQTDSGLPRMPPARGGLSAELHGQQMSWAERAFLRLETELVAEGEPAAGEEGEEPAPGEEGEASFGLETEGYALLDMEAGWEGRLSGRPLELTLRVENVTDTEYRDFLSRYKEFALAPGRNVSLRIGMTF